MEVIAPLDDEPPIHHHLGDPATSTPSVHATDEVISDLDEELLEEEICADLGIEERSSSFLWGPGAHVSDDSSRSAPSSPRRAGLRERRAPSRDDDDEPPPPSRGGGAARRRRGKTLPPQPSAGGAPAFDRASARGGKRKPCGVAIVGRKRVRVTLKDDYASWPRGLDDSTSEESLDGLPPPRSATPTYAPAALRRGASGVQSLPEAAEYRCSACGDGYSKRSHHNPWWALVQHECPKCGKIQFPSINIAAPANAILYHGAAAARPPADDDDVEDRRAADDRLDAVASMVPDLPEFGLDASEAPPPASPDRAVTPPGPPPAAAAATVTPESSDGDFTPPLPKRTSSALALVAMAAGAPASKDDDDDASRESDKPFVVEATGSADDAAAVAPAAAKAPPPPPPGGPRCPEALPEAASSQLFALFEHARYCPGEHASKKHREICTAAKFVMLHVRDCAGKLPNGADCPFSWCGPCRASVAKHHLPPVGSG